MRFLYMAAGAIQGLVFGVFFKILLVFILAIATYSDTPSGKGGMEGIFVVGIILVCLMIALMTIYMLEMYKKDSIAKLSPAHMTRKLLERIIPCLLLYGLFMWILFDVCITNMSHSVLRCALGYY